MTNLQNPPRESKDFSGNLPPIIDAVDLLAQPGVRKITKDELIKIVSDDFKYNKALEPWFEHLEDASAIAQLDLPEPVELVKGLLTERAKFMIASGSKSFKTWLTIDMALCIAHGAEFLGLETEWRRVLYVNLELKPETFWRRIQAVAQAKKLEVEQNCFAHLPLRGKIAGVPLPIIIERIIALVRHIGAGVVVLDPLYKLNQGDENSSRDQTVLMNEIDRLTTEGECAVILNDHFSKGNQSEKEPLDAIRGSSAKGGDIDAAMVLRLHDIKNCYRVDIVHRELAPVDPFVIGWQYPLMEIREDLNPDQMKKAKAGRTRAHDPRKLLAAIKDTTAENPISVNGWAKRADVKRQTLDGYLAEMRVKGWIRTVGEGAQARQCITPDGLKEVAS